jgi:hypothetical protein
MRWQGGGVAGLAGVRLVAACLVQQSASRLPHTCLVWGEVMIAKDFRTYAMNNLRQEKILHDHVGALIRSIFSESNTNHPTYQAHLG